MIFYSAAHLINLSNQLGLDAAEPNNTKWDNEIVDLWSNDKCDWKYFYSRAEEEEEEERNILIEYLRNKFTIAKRENRHTRYGPIPFNYISKYHKEQFLELVTALLTELRLMKQAEPKCRTVSVTAYPHDPEDPLYESSDYVEDEF
jgi:hypothetical protein